MSNPMPLVTRSRKALVTVNQTITNTESES
jgi:hypothetical protein